MDHVIIQQNPHWTGQKYPDLFHRTALENLLKQSKTRHIQVLTGIRRSGKSSIFRLLINELLNTNNPKSILFLNMDDPVYYTAWNNPSALYSIVEAAEKVTAEKVQYLFLDEIQSVHGWEHYVKSVYDSHVFKKIFVTGSNSSLLQNDFSTLLSGRYYSNEIFPYSLKELLFIHGISDSYSLIKEKPKVLGLLDDCIEYGCFPEIKSLYDTQLRRELLKSYFDSIILKDCVSRHQIADIGTFKKMLLYLMSNIGTLYSYNSLGKAIESNENTAKKYLNILTDCYVLSDITNFSLSQKITSRNAHKLYSIDNGLINAVAYRFFDNMATLFENFVYNELQKQKNEEISFINNMGECDFIVKNGFDYHAFQVCYQLTPTNQKRECAGFDKISAQIKVNRKVILTYNQEQQIGDIEVIPVWKFFMCP
jgi:predicted AAA+ superfamily ATPase